MKTAVIAQIQANLTKDRIAHMAAVLSGDTQAAATYATCIAHRERLLAILSK